VHYRIGTWAGRVIAVLPVLALLAVLRVEENYAVAFAQATMGILFDASEFAAVPSLGVVGVRGTSVRGGW
jgi:hypothetical protein